MYTVVFTEFLQEVYVSTKLNNTKLRNNRNSDYWNHFNISSIPDRVPSVVYFIKILIQPLWTNILRSITQISLHKLKTANI